VDSQYVDADRTFLGRFVAGADGAAGAAGAWLIWYRSTLFVQQKATLPPGLKIKTMHLPLGNKARC